MRRTTPLTAAVLASIAPALVLLTPSAATGAGETCRGEAATIVGAEGTRIVGTEGRDVVVTNGSQDVTSLGGDDAICVTAPEPARGTEKVRIDAGTGDDVVDGTSAPSWPVDGTLGTGSDRFEGGASDDVVHAGPYPRDASDAVDDEPDVLLGGGGDDYLSADKEELANAVVMDGGAGDDYLSLFTVPPAGSALTGGPGHDTLATGTEVHAFDWDLASGVFRVGESRTMPARGLENAFLAAPSIRLRGTGEDNRLTFVSCEVDVRGRGGDDSFGLTSDFVWEEYTSCPGDTVMVGGAGDDRFSTYGRGDDRLVGGRGNDEFVAKGGRDTVLGGPGRDTALTGRAADRFVGGPGKDRVDGEQGRDRCLAEREKNCER